ncbi:hypothetical protein [Burkholderia sp. BCC1999]|uniref:hypothetical protein n=1 Tax=Burkholderia sp. BCC1999 TaxID=2817448 RepID=UPI002AC31235|nr:hypothetical protein [Burkholderia sp. BCC1999]
MALSFEEGVARWLKRTGHAPNLAMWKGDAKFEIDISDRELFNEQLIETHFWG